MLAGIFYSLAFNKINNQQAMEQIKTINNNTMTYPNN